MSKRFDGGNPVDGGNPAEQWAAGDGSSAERRLVDDDTKVYPTELVYKPSLFGFYYAKRKETLIK